MTVQIRRTELADLPSIVALDQSIFGAYGADESPATIEARLSTFSAGCVVIEADEGIVGYLTTEKWAERREPALDEDPQLTHQPQGTVLNITTLAVASHVRGRGLGRLLLQEALRVAAQEGCHEIMLETAHARAFYQNHGYEWLGERVERGIRLDIMIYRLAQSK